MTALAFAAAQVAMLCGNAYAQTEASASEQGAKDGTTTTVVVTGQRKQLETAAAIKRNSDLIVDSVVADEAGKLPDKSITEVLQRVVGVTMDRNRSRQGASLAATGLEFNVEGSGIQVRGLSWGSSTLNGRETFSAGWPGRELSWGDVPPELMAGVDVYKNPSAELIEGGVSGQVDLRTRLPFDAKGQYGALSASGSYAELGKTKSPGFSGLYSNRWKTSMGEFGVLVDLSVNKNRTRFDSIGQSVYYPRSDLIAGKTAWVPVGVNYGTNTGDNQRTGFYGALQWKNNGMESALTYFDSAFHQTDSQSSIGITAGSNYGDSEDPYTLKFSNAKFDNNGVFQSSTLSHPIGGQGANQFLDGGIGTNITRNYSEVRGRTRELAWNFKWRVNESWSFQNDLQWVHATNSGNYGMINLGTFVPSMGVDETGSRPSFFFDDKARAFLADPRNYYWGISQPDVNKAKADLYAWKVDGKYTFDHPVLRDFRFGVRITERSSRKDKNAGTGWKSYSESWGVRPTDVAGQLPKVSDLGWQRSNFGYLSDPRYAALGNVEQYTFPNFFNGRMSAPPTIIAPTEALIHDHPDAYRKLLTALQYNCQDNNKIKGENTDCSTMGNDWKPAGYDNDPAHVSKHSEGSQALHGTLRFGFDDWKYPVDGNVGVRVVRTSTTANGYTVFKPNYSATTNPAVPRFGEVNDPLDLKASHVDVIPSLNLKMSLTDKLQSRLALSKGISRPGFDQMQEYITLHQNVTNDPKDPKQISMITYTGDNDGNVNLKPLKSNNFDVSLEWYPHPGQSLTATVFYKQVKDIILKETYTRTYKDLAGNDMEFTITGPANAAKARVRGVELAGMTYLDNLPGLNGLPDWAKGFGVSSNFTYIDSKQQLYHPFKGDYCPAGKLSGTVLLFGCDTNGLPYKDLPLPYMSKRALNLAFMYDHGPVSARLAYSWRDRTLLATGIYAANSTNGTSADPARKDANGVEPRDVGFATPIWQEAVGQWDAGISYRFTDHFSASFNASNLTRTVTRQTTQQTPGNMGSAWFDPGRSFRMLATYMF
ncbi:TonB-dependent receptor [Telluria mixta]|uniref:TonB-dependent receptor n=1 Tax=Telluria mixta TaxID=34071 RepID=A0ABT2C5X5_9BURK|nr:TonB-dependent receptor [Telluria mixta]MCS0632774.1 TonB-dependent receptor [Telluria mixta]WEM97851.1 TonB-dependent receptor [Telluria mixta]